MQQRRWGGSRATINQFFRKVKEGSIASEQVVPAAVDARGASRPRFSVVIPAFNEEAYLDECLDSLAAQDYRGIVEIIVVDNHSTDRTAEVARAHGVQVIAELERGVCQARQCGTLAARGEIIVSADADTVYDAGWLSKIEEWFVAHPAAIAVGGPCYFRNGPRWGLALQRMLFGGVALVRRPGGPVLYITATNFAFKREFWPGYDLRLTQGGDELDLLRKLRRLGRVDFDPGNPSWTSARRMEKGVAYNFAISFFYYYILGYAVNRILKRPALGMAPAFRRESQHPPIPVQSFLDDQCNGDHPDAGPDPIPAVPSESKSESLGFTATTADEWADLRR